MRLDAEDNALGFATMQFVSQSVHHHPIGRLPDLDKRRLPRHGGRWKKLSFGVKLAYDALRNNDTSEEISQQLQPADLGEIDEWRRVGDDYPLARHAARCSKSFW